MTQAVPGIATAPGTDTYAEAFDTLSARVDHPDWLVELRRAAFDRFVELGLPGPRHEDWRSTSIKPITDTSYQLAGPGARGLTTETLEAHTFEAVANARLVFVDGHLNPEQSEVHDLPDGVIVCSIAEAIRDHADLVRAHLAKHVDITESTDAFAALNTAMIEDGIFVYLPQGVVVDKPMRMLSFSSCSDEALVTHPRVLVIAEPNSQATFVETYGSACDCTAWVNKVAEISVADGANVQHYMLERENELSVNVSTLRATVGRDATFESHRAIFGGGLVRNNVHAKLAGQGSHASLNGVYATRNSQHVDNQMRIEHAAPNTTSNQLYKGILNDKSSAIFTGRIVVDPVAQKTDAVQTCRNLLLSDTAKAQAKPQLEIFADDVKCTHGATTGQIDDDAMFYAKARGIDPELARSMLTYAFAHEVLDHMRIDSVRTLLERALLDRLPQSDKLKALFD